MFKPGDIIAHEKARYITWQVLRVTRSGRPIVQRADNPKSKRIRAIKRPEFWKVKGENDDDK